MIKKVSVLESFSCFVLFWFFAAVLHCYCCWSYAWAIYSHLRFWFILFSFCAWKRRLSSSKIRNNFKLPSIILHRSVVYMFQLSSIRTQIHFIYFAHGEHKIEYRTKERKWMTFLRSLIECMMIRLSCCDKTKKMQRKIDKMCSSALLPNLFLFDYPRIYDWLMS